MFLISVMSPSEHTNRQSHQTTNSFNTTWMGKHAMNGENSREQKPSNTRYTPSQTMLDSCCLLGKCFDAFSCCWEWCLTAM